MTEDAIVESERILERASEYADLFRSEMIEQTLRGHDRIPIFQGIAKALLNDHNENPWDYEQLLALFTGSTFLLAEATTEVDRLRRLLSASPEGNRRSGRLRTSEES